MLKFLKKTYFLFIPLIVTAVSLALRLVRYGAVDDILMFNIANSYSFNENSEILMFINVGIGYLIKLLYGITDAVNWFSVVYLLLFNLGFITYLKLLEKREAPFAFTVIVSGIQFYLIMRISFTLIAFVLACAGIMWFLNYVDKLSKTNIKHILYSLILLILAFSMRNSSTLYCVLLVFVGVIVFSVIKKRNTVPVVALIVAMCILANVGVTAVNRAYKRYEINDTFYFQFQEYRSEASDNGKINYKKHKKEFNKAGISKNDLDIFKQFIYGDKNVYTPDMLKTICDTRDFNDRYNIKPVKILKNVKRLESPLINYIFYYALFAVILFILYKRKRLELFTSGVFLAAAELYLFIRRRGVVRVTDPIAAIGLLILIYIVSEEKDSLKEFKLFKKLGEKRAGIVLTICILALTVALSGVWAHTYNKKFIDYSDTTELVQQDTEHTYLAAPLSADKLYDQHLTLLTSSYNFVPVYAAEGEWWIYSSYWYKLMNKLELNEYCDNSINSILKENVRFVSRNKDLPEYLVKYYKEHYNLNVKYELLNRYNGAMKVYEFYIKD